MHDFTPNEMIEVAREVYPDASIEKNIYGNPLICNGNRCALFSPKLDGTDREKAQALDCIVAALKLITDGKVEAIEITPHTLPPLEFRVLVTPPDADWSFWGNILTFSMRAILESK